MDSTDMSPRKLKCVISNGRVEKRKGRIEVSWMRVRVTLGALRNN